MEHGVIQEPRYKTIAWRIAYCLLIGLVLLQAIGTFKDWVTGVPDRKVHEGQVCGPEHHWVYVRTNVTDPDLSCEHD